MAHLAPLTRPSSHRCPGLARGTSALGKSARVSGRWPDSSLRATLGSCSGTGTGWGLKCSPQQPTVASARVLLYAQAALEAARPPRMESDTGARPDTAVARRAMQQSGPWSIEARAAVGVKLPRSADAGPVVMQAPIGPAARQISWSPSPLPGESGAWPPRGPRSSSCARTSVTYSVRSIVRFASTWSWPSINASALSSWPSEGSSYLILVGCRRSFHPPGARRGSESPRPSRRSAVGCPGGAVQCRRPDSPRRRSGGHVQSRTPLHRLVRELRRALSHPILAAGGIGDAASAAAAIAAGATGVVAGTAYLLADEADVHPIYRDRLRDAGASATCLTGLFDGGWPDAPHRVLVNKTLESWKAAGSPLPGARPGEGDRIASRGGHPIPRYSDAQPTRDTSGDDRRHGALCRDRPASLRETKGSDPSRRACCRNIIRGIHPHPATEQTREVDAATRVDPPLAVGHRALRLRATSERRAAGRPPRWCCLRLAPQRPRVTGILIS